MHRSGAPLSYDAKKHRLRTHDQAHGIFIILPHIRPTPESAVISRIGRQLRRIR